MSEYLFNVGMVFTTYLMYALCVFVVVTVAAVIYNRYGDDSAYVVHRRQYKRILTIRNWASLLVLLYGVWLAIGSRTHTPKNETVDRTQLIQEHQITSVRESSVIQDLSPKPKLSDEERSARFKELTNYKD